MDKRFCSRTSKAKGSAIPVGWLPALKALNLFWSAALRIASAMMLRAELPQEQNIKRAGLVHVILL
jgi:hypothetical protein